MQGSCAYINIDKYIERLITESTPDLPIWNIENIRQGKKPHWNYIDGCMITSLLALSEITGEKKYFDFATYIVDCGGTEIVNIFDLAYENKFYPYQYPVTKAYEMISCFEGLFVSLEPKP